MLSIIIILVQSHNILSETNKKNGYLLYIVMKEEYHTRKKIGYQISFF